MKTLEKVKFDSVLSWLNLLIQNEYKFPLPIVYNTVIIIWSLYHYTFFYKWQLYVEVCEISRNTLTWISIGNIIISIFFWGCDVKQWAVKV